MPADHLGGRAIEVARLLSDWRLPASRDIAFSGNPNPRRQRIRLHRRKGLLHGFFF
jgi:hypothetical protein